MRMILLVRRERTQPTLLGKSQGSGDRFVIGELARGFPIFLLDTGDTQRLDDSPLAVAAPRQRARFGEGIAGVIDKTPLGEAFCDGFEIGRTAALPAALAHFALQIGPKL